LDALNHRHLKFNEAEQAAILHKLQSRAAGAESQRTRQTPMTQLGAITIH
jgi:hypothetical protein